jgi:hypothetical protein
MKSLMKIIAVAFITVSINTACKKDVSNECDSCDQKLPVQSFSNVAGTIQKVSEGEPYYNGQKYFILVDAQTSLSALFSQNGNKFERLFPCSNTSVYSDVDTGKVVSISGKLSKCTTGNHGLLTNNLITLNIFEP